MEPGEVFPTARDVVVWDPIWFVVTCPLDEVAEYSFLTCGGILATFVNLGVQNIVHVVSLALIVNLYGALRLLTLTWQRFVVDRVEEPRVEHRVDLGEIAMVGKVETVALPPYDSFTIKGPRFFGERPLLC